MASVWDQFSDPVEAAQADQSWDAFSDPVAAPEQPQVTRESLIASNPAEYDSASPEYQAKYGATSGMTGGQRFFAGTGKAFTDLARGTGQLIGAVDRQDVAESRERDAPLMRSGLARVGNLAGNVAATIPAIAIPGANTVAGAGLIGAGLGLAQPSTSTRETVTNVGLGGATGAGAQALGGKIAQWAGNRVTQRAASAATKQSQNAVRDATLQQARQAGYVVPPSTTNPTVANRAIESLAGKAQTQQVAAVRNQQVTNRLVRKALELPDDAPLTKATLDGVRKKAGAVYKAIAEAGDIAVDGQYVDDLAGIAQSMDDVAKDFPDLNLNNNAEVTKLVDGMMQDKFSAKSAVELTKQLRKSASGNLSGANAADPAKRALGYAQRDAAAAVEDQMIRHLEATGKGALAKAFDSSRKLIAKTYSAESALNEGTGNIIAKNLGAQLKKGKPLSGEMELVAKFAQSFGKAAQEITDSPGVSALDAMFGVAGGATLNPALVGLPVARNLTRSAITAPGLNRVMGNPSYSPGRVGQGVLRGTQAVGRRAALPAASVAVQGEQ